MSASHAPDCKGCGGTYACSRCEREFGWCTGAMDDTPALCDDCANLIQGDPLKTAPETIEEFERLWADECREWQAIKDAMIEAGKTPSAYDVTAEQRRRMTARGELPVMDSVFARRLVTRAIAIRRDSQATMKVLEICSVKGRGATAIIDAIPKGLAVGSIVRQGEERWHVRAIMTLGAPWPGKPAELELEDVDKTASMPVAERELFLEEDVS